MKLVLLDKNGLPIKRLYINIGNRNLAMKYTITPTKVSSLPHFKVKIENGILKITGFMQKGQSLLLYPAGEKI